MHRSVSSEASRRNTERASNTPIGLLAEIDAILAARPAPMPLPAYRGKPVDLGPIPAHVVVGWRASA